MHKRTVRKWFGLSLSLILLLSVVSGLGTFGPHQAEAASDPNPNWHLEDGKLVFRGPMHAHDLLYMPLDWEQNPEEVVAEADLTPVEGAGSSWAPALILYWSSADWVSVGVAGNEQFTTHPGSYIGTAPLGETYRVRIVWQGETVQLWGGPKGSELTLLRTANAPAAGPPPYLIVGKGYGDETRYTEPFLANDYSSPGSPGYVYMDNISVVADNELKKLEENFEAGIDLARWTLRVSPASEPKPPPTTEELFPNWEVPAERGPASEPTVLYKAEQWAAYHEHYANDPEFREHADEKITMLQEDVGLVMGFDEAEIDHMIPETTPLANLFTPCPNAPDKGFPHGDWTWSPEDPDRIYCDGMAFPNDQYPEEGEMILNWDGAQQKITYYNEENYEFAGFQLSPSFTSYIRAKKVTYMAKKMHRIAWLYRLTGDESYAQQAEKILLRFAEVYPHWFLHSGYGEFADMDPKEAAFNINRLPKFELTTPGNEPNRALHAGYWMAGRANANGMEGSFMLHLISTYDLIADVEVNGTRILSDAERLQIERDLLLEAATLFIADPAMNNKAISNRTAAAAIGIIIEEPKLVHFGLEAFNEFLGDWFKEDGSPIESPAYGLQVLGYMWQLGEILNDYSDPEGYQPPDGSQPIEDFNVYDRPNYRMVYKTLGESLLPSMTYPVVGDSYMTSAPAGYLLSVGATRTGLPILSSLLRHGEFNMESEVNLLYRPEGLDQADAIQLPDHLFPQWRLAYMRGGDTNMDSTAILNASGWGGHRHKDSLDFTYWANGGEALSDLGYLWDSPQKHMTSRSAAHNLVIVNQKDQVTSNRGGSFNFYETTGPFSATEASSDAYAEAEIYNRTLLQVEAGERKPEYVVDFFRVQGGNTHDYMLHAATSDFSTSQIDLTSGGKDAVSAYDMTDVQTANTADVWTADWKNAGGEGRTTAWHVPTEAESVYIGDGWGQRGTDDVGAELPYMVRRADNSDTGNVFATVVESYTGKSGISDVKPLTSSEEETGALAPIGLQISGSGWHDFVMSATDGRTRTFTGDYGRKPITFSGKLGVLSFAKGNGKGGLQYAFLAGEGRIEYEGEVIEIAEGERKEGTVSENLTDGFMTANAVAGAEQWIGSHVLVRKGDDWTAYPVLDVQTEDGQTHFVTYNGEEGFPFAGGKAWKLVPYAAAERTPNGEWEVIASGGQVTLISPRNTSSADMKTLIDRYEDDGSFTGEQTAHNLKVHLTAVEHFENQDKSEKVVKHMKGFKVLLDHQRENGLISERAYYALMAHADALMKKWR